MNEEVNAQAAAKIQQKEDIKLMNKTILSETEK